MKGSDFLMPVATPNFYFHATTAYAILRHNGVDVGKMAYIGSMPLQDAPHAPAMQPGSPFATAGHTSQPAPHAVTSLSGTQASPHSSHSWNPGGHPQSCVAVSHCSPRRTAGRISQPGRHLWVVGSQYVNPGHGALLQSTAAAHAPAMHTPRFGQTLLQTPQCSG